MSHLVVRLPEPDEHGSQEDRFSTLVYEFEVTASGALIIRHRNGGKLDTAYAQGAWVKA